jgi:transcriptional regulator with XRE-family HTH domain
MVDRVVEFPLMAPAELRCRRLALGLNQERFADVLGVKQSTVSEWESPKKKLIPPGVVADVAELEDLAEALVVRMVADAWDSKVIVVHADDDAFWAGWAVLPGVAGVPVELEWAAAGVALRRLAALGVVARVDAATSP